jgi:hypothetical protein
MWSVHNLAPFPDRRTQCDVMHLAPVPDGATYPPGPLR